MTRLVCTLLALLCFCPRHSPAESSATVGLVKSHKSSWRIATVSRDVAARWGAKELQKYLKQISHCDLTIVENAGKGPAIVVGLRADLSAEDKALLPLPARGYDGYAIAIVHDLWKADRIIIAGDNGRGAIYGCYDLLERVGCRWFYPAEDPSDPEVVPHLESLRVPTGAWAVASPMKYRFCNGSGWFFDLNPPEALAQLDWAMKNRYNGVGWQGANDSPLNSQYQHMRKSGLLSELEKRGMVLHGPAHSFNHFLRAEDYMKDHPEWFGMRNGKRAAQDFSGAQFCWSNPEARKQFIDNAEAFITNAPEIHVFCAVPFDGGAACDCPACKKIGASNLLMALMNELIERLEVSRPDVLVETVGGYGPMTDPPADVAINPKQRVVWAHWGRYYGVPYGDPRYDRQDNLEKWRKAARGGLTVCQYYTDNFAEPWVMAPFTVAIDGDRKYFLQNGIDSLYMLMWPRGYWWNHSLNGYLAGRCFYDVSLNASDLIRDYANHYYGTGAGALLADYFNQWARHCDLSYNVRGDSTDEQRARLAKQRKQLIQPAVEMSRNDPVLTLRVGKVEKLHALAEQLMEMHRQRGEIQKAIKAHDCEKASALLAKAQIYTGEVLDYFYYIADLNQGLMDRNEVPSFIKANVKGWLDEEEKALAVSKGQK